MVTIKKESNKITLSTTLDPDCNDMYDVVMYVKYYNINNGWFIRKNGKPIGCCEMLWDDRYILHSVLKREFSKEFANPKSNFSRHFSVLLMN